MVFFISFFFIGVVTVVYSLYILLSIIVIIIITIILIIHNPIKAPDSLLRRRGAPKFEANRLLRTRDQRISLLLAASPRLRHPRREASSLHKGRISSPAHDILLRRDIDSHAPRGLHVGRVESFRRRTRRGDPGWLRRRAPGRAASGPAGVCAG